MDIAAGTIIAWTLLGTAGTSAGTTSVRKPAPGIQTAVLEHIGYVDVVTGSAWVVRCMCGGLASNTI